MTVQVRILPTLAPYVILIVSIIIFFFSKKKSNINFGSKKINITCVFFDEFPCILIFLLIFFFLHALIIDFCDRPVEKKFPAQVFQPAGKKKLLRRKFVFYTI